MKLQIPSFFCIAAALILVYVYRPPASAAPINAKDLQLAECSNKLSNCPGRCLNGRGSENYSIENAIGDGLIIQGGNVHIMHPLISGATGNGIVVNADSRGGLAVFNASVRNVSGNGIELKGNNCMILDAVVDGAGGIGLLVNGNFNTIQNVSVKNCARPIVVRGVGNIIEWTPKVAPKLKNRLYPNLDRLGGSSTFVQGQTLLPTDQPGQSSASVHGQIKLPQR